MSEVPSTITIDLDSHGSWHYFENQQAWNESPYSRHYHFHKWKWGTYQPQASSEPCRFPCYALEAAFSHNPDGADWQHFAFLYPEPK